MEKAGPEFYDDAGVFVAYIQHRQRPDAPNETLEKPVILELVDAIANQRILDLGCGDARIGREFLQQGAASYTGVEGSHNMAEAARSALTGTSGQVIQQANCS